MNYGAVAEGALTRYGVKAKRGTLGPDDPIDWIEKFFFIPELEGPIALQPYHRAVLREAYRTDADGKFVYSLVLWGDIKKSAKTSIAAAVALERARRHRYGSIKVVANDQKQATSRVFEYARRAVELNPRLASKVYHREGGNFLRFPNRCNVEAIALDPKGEAGGNDDMIVFSELWGFTTKAAIQMWGEMTLSPTKQGYSQRWVETYAGYSGESTVLEAIYETGVKNGREIDLGIPGLEVYANEAASQLTLWNTLPRCPWQTSEYYAAEKAVQVPEEYERIHRNQWVRGTHAFVPMEWYDACKATPLPELDKYKELIVSLDAAVDGDCFGIVGVSRHADKVALRYARKWTPPLGGKLEYENYGDKNDVNYPEGALRWLCANYNVIAVVYDPYQLHDFCTRLKNEGVAYFFEFPQGAERAEADKQLYDLVRDRRFLHDGNADLREHVQNADRKTDGEKMRIIKRKQSLKIDLAVCASMAAKRALELLAE